MLSEKLPSTTWQFFSIDVLGEKMLLSEYAILSQRFLWLHKKATIKW